MKDGKKLLGELEARPAGVYFRTHNLLTTGDGTPALKWGSHQRLHRGRRRQAGLRLDDRRPHLRHLPRARRAAVRADRLHAARRCRPSPSRISTSGRPGAKYDEIFTGWAYPPKDYDEVGRAGLPVGEALRRAVRPRGSRDVVLGGVERAEHRLLARHAARSSSSCTTTRSTACGGRCRRRGSAGRTRPAAAASSRATSSSTACAARTTPRARPARRSTSSSFHAKGAPTFVDGHVRMGIANQLRTIDDGFRHRRLVPGAEGQADRHRRIRPRGLRRLPGAAARLSQRHDVLQLHRRQLRPQARPGRQARREPRRRADLGVRVRGPAATSPASARWPPTASTSRC